MTTSMKLYEIADARAILEAWLEESEGELTPALEQLLADLAGAETEKIERVALFIREQLASADAIEEEIKRLGTRVSVQRRAAEGLKAYLKLQLERLGVTKVNGLLATVAIQKNGQPAIRTALEPVQLYALEDARAFVKREETVVYTLDRAMVLAAWKANEPLPAALAVEQGTHLRIR